LSQRTALILFIAVVSGIGIGVLTFFAEKSYPQAVLASVIAAGGCSLIDCGVGQDLPARPRGADVRRR
jgi:predicted phage tail protein